MISNANKINTRTRNNQTKQQEPESITNNVKKNQNKMKLEKMDRTDNNKNHSDKEQ